MLKFSSAKILWSTINGSQVIISDGSDGLSCTVADNQDGTKTLACEDGTQFTINDGANGSSCTVIDNQDGTKTLTCEDGTQVTISDGANGSSCTVNDNPDGSKTLRCDDGTQVTIPAETAEDQIASVGPESCVVCHSKTGWEHQRVYDEYTDTSALELKITGVVSSADPTCIGTLACKQDSDCLDNSCDASGFCEGEIDNKRCNDGTCDEGVCSGEYSSVVTFEIKKNGVPYIDLNVDPSKPDLPSLAQARFIIAWYDSQTDQFVIGGKYYDQFKATGTPGEYTAVTGPAPGTRAPLPWAPENTDAVVYGYIADDLLDTEGGGSMYNNVASAAAAFGALDTAGAYQSAANVSGCEKCHGSPYMKHGYRNPVVAGIDDFVSCKTCHYDTRNGNHPDWQILVDDPARYAEIASGSPLTNEEKNKYAYKANVMNDVHMSHAMEFPYPQSMANCVTCHEGKLDVIQDDDNFTRETCLSCHPLTGSETYGTSDMALKTFWAKAGVEVFHNNINSESECNYCHKNGGPATTRLKHLHNGGYDKKIYTNQGERYADIFTVSIDDVSFDSATNLLSVGFSATESRGVDTVAGLDAKDIIPTVMIGLYGYDTKDFIVNAHGRDADQNRLLEFAIDGVSTNPRFTVLSASAGSWEIEADLSMWADMITDGTIQRAEIGVLPAQILVVGEADVNVGSCDPGCGRGFYCSAENTCKPSDDITLALNAPSRTFDFANNDFDDAFFNDIVDIQGCNNCHDALATTFHSANRGGNIRVCRLCHVGLSGASHLEMQSRSIDSYVHAVHSFQAFDSDEVDFSNPVEALRYEHHIEHVYPNFTIKNCESCHNPGTYNVPDQSKSMPGKLSPSYAWDTERNIPAVSDFVTGPATRACGSCHLTHKINEDDANGLLALFQHTKGNGYLIEDAEGILEKIIKKIMAMFD